MAENIYNNLGPGDTWIVNQDYQASFAFMATPFITTAAGNLDEVRTSIFSLTSPTSFGLYTDSGGAPATLLESWSAAVPGIPGVLMALDLGAELHS